MSQNEQHPSNLSSPASSTASTPLYRVFRGLKSTQVVPIPSTNAAWRTTLSELRMSYLEGRWKECESECLRLVGSCRDLPVIRAYLLFLIGCCVEMQARNMHQYSAAKPKKIEDAAMWFQRCKTVLTNTISLPGDSDVEDVVSTPRAYKGSPVYGSDISPLVQKKERIGRLTKTISPLIDGGANSSFCDETDSFTSNDTALRRKSLFVSKHSYSYVQPRLTPPPLRIRKCVPLHVDIPSPSLSSTSFASPEAENWDESIMRTPVQRHEIGLRSLASIMEDIGDCTWASETSEVWNDSMMGRGQDVAYQSCQEDLRDSFTVGETNGFTSQAIYEARIEAKKEALRAGIERRVAERMHKIDEPLLISSSSFTSLLGTKGGMPRSVSDMIRDYLRKESAEQMTPSCLRPIPMSSSAKPLPLCLKPKQSTRLSDSDESSLARLQHAWEVTSFGGWYMVDSDCHSLSIVEQTWSRLRASYHLDKTASHVDLDLHIARFNHQLSSLVHFLHQNISDLHRLASEISHHRTIHLQTQKMPPSKSYWSFSVQPIDAASQKSCDDIDDDEHHHNHNTKDMRFNSGWAAPGTILNESKTARIERLRKDGFKTVGLGNEQRGHKGDEWYAKVCEEALKDVTCL